MTYLIGQILLCLLLASMLGLVAGWLLCGMRCRADINLLNQELEARGKEIEQSEQRILALQRSAKELDYACKEEQQLAQARIQQLESFQAEAVWLRQELDDISALKNKQLRYLRQQLEPVQSMKHEIKVRETVIQRLESQLRTQAQAKDRQVEDLLSRLREMQPKTTSGTRDPMRRTAGQDTSGQDSPGSMEVVDPVPAGPARPLPTSGAKASAAHPDAVHKQNSAALPTTSSQSALSASPVKDDLKKIRGIGPVMERMLNDLGVTSFKQIMEFTRDDVERVTAAIKVFPGRIERDNWIGGAKKEYRKKYANES